MSEKGRTLKLILNLILPILAVIATLYLGGKLIVLFMPFFVGWVISLIANPLVRFLEKKLKIVRKAGSVIVIVVVLALIVLACYGIIAGAVREIKHFSQDVPAMVEGVKVEYSQIATNVGQFVDKLPQDTKEMVKGLISNVSGYVSEAVTNIGKSGIVDKAGDFASNVPEILAGIVFGLLASYFFIAEKEQIDALTRKLVPSGVKKEFHHLKTDLFDVLIGYFKAQFKIMAVIYVLLCIGLAILKVPYFLIWGFFIAFLDMLPIFGTGAVLWPWMIIEVLSGDIKTAVGLLIIYIVTLLTHQLIQPKLIGDSIGLNPFATLFFMYIGFKVNGVVGMVIAIPIGMILYKMLKTGTFDTMIYAGQELGKEIAGFLHLEKKSDVKETDSSEKEM